MNIRINNVSTHVITPFVQAKVDKAGFKPSVSKNTEANSSHCVSLSSASLMGMESLLAMQETDDGLRERRRRQLRRASHILDTLDEMKIALIEGKSGDVTLLNKLISEPFEQTGDEKLDTILGQIETLAWVERAKRTRQ